MADAPEYKRDQLGKFVPGGPGGPGRPKGSVSLVGAIKRKLRERPELEDELAQALIDLALDKGGDHRALGSIKELIDRIDGAVVKKQQLDVTGDKVKLVRLAGDEDDGEEEGEAEDQP